jgi:hypothetical protein
MARAAIQGMMLSPKARLDQTLTRHPLFDCLFPDLVVSQKVPPIPDVARDHE